MPERLGVLYGALWSHVLAMILMVVLGFDGLLRLLLEQFGFALALLATPEANAAEQLLLMLHAIGLIALSAFLWLWRREDPRAQWALPAAAVSQLFLAPIGLVVAGALFWLRRQEDWLLAPLSVAGERRNRIGLTWLIGAGLTALAALPAFLVLGANPLIWFTLMVLAASPQGLLLWWLMRQELRHEAVMPALPEPVAR